MMMGYYKDQEATRNAINSEGFLRSGDTGALTTDGQLNL